MFKKLSRLFRSVIVVLVALWLFGERGRVLRPSTRRWFRTAGLRRLLDLSAFHGYVYLRWTNQYIGFMINHALPFSRVSPQLGAWGRQWVANHYHAKVLTPDDAKAIITINQPIALRDLEQIVPFPMARDLVLNGSPDIAVYDCCCRMARPDHCEPTQVCMVVGQPFVGFILEHNPHSSRSLTQGEALALLEAEHERGHVHVAYFKDACMGRFYVVCNCCPCCCGGIEMMVEYGTSMVASSGYVAQVDDEACIACGECEAICPFQAIHVDSEAVVTWEQCMGCGVCVDQCVNDALSLVRDERKGIPLDVRQMVNS